MKVIDKNRKLSKSDYKKYIDWLNENYSVCQCDGCFNTIDDWHHSIFGAYKDDKSLVGLCRHHHLEAHKHKHDMQDYLIDIGLINWLNYNISIDIKIK